MRQRLSVKTKQTQMYLLDFHYQKEPYQLQNRHFITFPIKYFIW